MITGIKSIDHRAATRTLYELDGTTPRGERIGVEFTACTNDGSKHSLPNIWYKAGYTPAPLPSYWAVNVYATDAAGCWGRYNPTEKMIEETTEWQRWNGQRHVSTTHKYILDFDWVLPATPANRHKILTEIIRRANKE